MIPPEPTKNQFITVRLTRSQKALIAKAAELSDQTISQFMISAALDECQWVFDKPGNNAKGGIVNAE